MWSSPSKRSLPNNPHLSICHSETDVSTGIRHPIDALCLVVILRTRIKRQHLTQPLKLFFRETGGYFLGNLNFQTVPFMFVNEAALRLRIAVGIAHVGLYVVNGSSVHQVSPLNMNNRPQLRKLLYINNMYAREAKSVRSERRTRGKHPYPLVSSQARRAHGQSHRIVTIGRESPYQPQMAERFQSPYSFSMPIGWFENNPSAQRRG